MNEKENILDLIRQGYKKKNDKSEDIQAFLNILSADERERYLALTLDEDKEAFINNVMLSRSGALHQKISKVAIDQKIAKDIDEVTPENLKELLRTKKTDELERELGTGMNAIKREYVQKISKQYVEKRNKKSKNGNLDIYLNSDEFRHIDKMVEAKLFDNPAYKFSLIVINNASGTIDVFNDKMVESKRDYEINKLVFCNEKGMTPESYDAWQEYVKLSIKEECINTENGFDNIAKFDEKWHVDTFRKFYRKTKGFVKGETLVYESKFLQTLDDYDKETIGTSRNPTMGSILNEFDKGMLQVSSKTAEDIEAENIVGVSGGVNSSPRVLKGLEHRKKQLSEKVVVTPTEPEVKEDIKEHEVIETPDILKFFNKNQESEVVEETKKEEVSPTEATVEETVVVKDEENADVVSEIVVESTPTNSGIVDVVVNPDVKLRVFRNPDIEKDVIVKYVRQPDISILKNINDPKLRINAYKNSAVTSGYRLPLAYSGYDVILKKITDKSRLSHIYTMIDNMWNKRDLEQFVEMETLKIIYENLEFPTFDKHPTFKEFTTNLSLGDVPILIVTLAMTNIPEDEKGRIRLSFKNLRCTDPHCNEIIPLTEILIDLKDLFSKIYPYKNFKDRASKADNPDIDSAYRNTKSGELHLLTANDDDDICKYSIYYSRPTVYKDTTVERRSGEVNYSIVKEDLSERKDMYKEMYGLTGLDEYLIDMSYDGFQERSATLASNLAVLDSNSNEFTEEEFTAISKFIQNNATEIATVSELLETNYTNLARVFNLCKYIDVILVDTIDGEPIVKISDCQANMFDTIQTISQMPNKIINELIAKTNELGSDYKFEHDNVFYTSEDIKRRIDSDFIKKYSNNDNKEYIAYLKANNPNITQKHIDEAISEKERSFKQLLEGKCVCGNDTFFINYMTIVFFSIYNR